MTLADTACKNAHKHVKASSGKAFKLFDENGLYLLIAPRKDGAWSKGWRFKYRVAGKEKLLSLGVYPDISLQKARDLTDKMRKQLSASIDPSQARRDEKIEKTMTFETVARNCLNNDSHTLGDSTAKKKLRRFELHVFSKLGNQAITSIKAADIYETVKPLIDDKKLETAHRCLSEITAVLDYAINHRLLECNVATSVGKRLPSQNVKHRASLIDPKDIGQLLRDIWAYQGTFTVQTAFKLSPLLFQRPGEIRQMEWNDIDLDAKQWRYFVTKTKSEHIVPLSTQAIELLTAIKLLTGHGKYVFPSLRSDNRPMSDNTIRTALLTLGYDSDTMTAHGFRSIASTLLNEQGFTPDAIERQLCHMPRDHVRAAYNRAQYLPERVSMMQAWADYLDGIRKGAEIIKLTAKAGSQ